MWTLHCWASSAPRKLFLPLGKQMRKCRGQVLTITQRSSAAFLKVGLKLAPASHLCIYTHYLKLPTIQETKKGFCQLQTIPRREGYACLVIWKQKKKVLTTIWLPRSWHISSSTYYFDSQHEHFPLAERLNQVLLLTSLCKVIFAATIWKS